MKVPVPATVPAAEDLGRVHFVGIGGAGLSGIARIMLARGIAVSGSDGVDSPTLASLRAAGATVHVGHDDAHVADADTLVVSTAVREDNPEYLEAVRRGLLVLPRSTALASVMAGRRVVAVAGTHGKTTTTSLLTVALQAAGADPTYAVGGELAATGTNAAEGAGELFVAEADESDGAFLHYSPYAAIVTNVDADHLDQWGTPEAYAAAFDEFADTLDPDGFLVCVVDDPGAAALAARQRDLGRRVVTVSTRADGAADGSVGGSVGGSVDVGPDALAGVTLWSPGDHYLADALAALAAGITLGLDPDALRAGLASYTGTKRRMEPKGEAGGVRVYDSYAHHPVEIVGDLQSARALAGEGRLVVAFQPHLVSRTRIFGEAMGQALGAADEVVVADVYLAREDPDPEVTGAYVAASVPLPADRVAFVPDLEDVAAELVRRARPGDLVLTLGAGTITTVGPRVLELLPDHG
ncbi:UDP-N-acetylmuramate--L-alanine ligase [Nocardioides sp. zg-579]|uniref:UDP-N-acetylmuramate--L-alanine ligase n=1 Tax=Nocardioides marmotae TaxID=2663857 RepID=A0A6I3JBT2_9ACTN|nr:UDP-N-acetylmuramate--L-alanine ligase [Nocardioides marmotae]MCR6031971.1 UDP-N-acetylmuramate--L-alanine ligase [Gordonia jinghuaiqii]MTB95612.1 UDP-N-acetylmuramate--L-alanine ligase [Nocardioides marmotae]QKE01029.1 UDP-N-acetylmuramate--L-alanine ligase [Nocardioides marmotae]